MKIMIIYAQEGKMEEYIKYLRQGAEEAGHQVIVKEARDRGELVSCHSYDLLIVGSPVYGTFKARVSERVQPYLSSVKRIGGQEAVAITNHKLFGTDKGLRKLMQVMESQGCIVKDFKAFRSPQEAYRYGVEL